MGKTFNAYTAKSESYDIGNIPVWLQVDETYPGGATLTLTAGQKIAAGTPIVVATPGGEGAIYTGAGSEGSAAKPTGLVWNDAYSDTAGRCSVAVVTKGQVLADRCPDTLTDAVMALLPTITFVKES